jgi:hypothetical protein
VINMITGRGSVIMPPVLEHLELTAVNFTGNDTARSIAGTLFDPKRNGCTIRVSSRNRRQDFGRRPEL